MSARQTLAQMPEPKRSAEVLDADLIEGVEAAEEAIKAIQEMGALIDVDDGVVAGWGPWEFEEL